MPGAEELRKICEGYLSPSFLNIFLDSVRFNGIIFSLA